MQCGGVVARTQGGGEQADLGQGEDERRAGGARGLGRALETADALRRIGQPHRLGGDEPSPRPSAGPVPVDEPAHRAWALFGFAHVYTGIAQRAYDLTVHNVHRRTSIALTRSMAHHPEVQHQIAEMWIKLEAIDGYLG
ncbi:MAG: Acyl-CoA dehydrogenase, C-terminal domain, partial [Nonomuraea muscovyensis]|nr:Acyl-CoA dehydrogenase, C-terminal domain [Nonomuraea muscovyensis]